jgi:hypothetical protein
MKSTLKAQQPPPEINAKEIEKTQSLYTESKANSEFEGVGNDEEIGFDLDRVVTNSKEKELYSESDSESSIDKDDVSSADEWITLIRQSHLPGYVGVFIPLK